MAAQCHLHPPECGQPAACHVLDQPQVARTMLGGVYNSRPGVCERLSHRRMAQTLTAVEPIAERFQEPGLHN